MVPIRLYALGIVGVAFISGLIWGGHKLYVAGFNDAVARQKSDEALIKAAADAAQTAAAKAISSIEVKHVTIRQNLEKELTRDVIYRDCVASPSVLQLTNEAITGESQSTGDRVVPTAEPINDGNL